MTDQLIPLFGGVVALLALASAIGFVLARRANSPAASSGPTGASK